MWDTELSYGMENKINSVEHCYHQGAHSAAPTTGQNAKTVPWDLSGPKHMKPM
jgi:hypothetical protein